ncbi:MAG: hypothetical protein OXF20_00790 [Gammaproteobacteria bacterium]|nr:hypothetical protein [Gammaproteobacteria bacterium]
MIKMVDEKTKKSESRVLSAIAQLDQKVDGLTSKADSLSSEVTEINVKVSGCLNFHMLAVVALVIAVIFGITTSS